jgi:hypothetical protein
MKKDRQGRARNEKDNGDITIEIDVKRVGFLAVTIFMCLLLALSVFLFIRGFLPVSDFELRGIAAYYDRDDLIAASGVEFGDMLYDVDVKSVEEKIMAACPYLEDIDVDRVFPNKIRFEVVEKTPQWYIEITGDFYVLDSDLTVLQESTSEEILRGRGLTRLSLPAVKSAMCGSLPAFGADELEIKRSCEIINTLRSHKIKERITDVDISNRFAINIILDGSYYVFLGDVSLLEAKLDALAEMLTPEICAKYPSADIDMSNPSTPSLLPKAE